ncbi:hypothetical protein ACJJTC_010618 [Scirpophaga incertulas]
MNTIIEKRKTHPRMDFYRKLATIVKRKPRRVVIKHLPRALLRQIPYEDQDIDCQMMSNNEKTHPRMKFIRKLRAMVAEKVAARQNGVDTLEKSMDYKESNAGQSRPQPSCRRDRSLMGYNLLSQNYLEASPSKVDIEEDDLASRNLMVEHWMEKNWEYMAHCHSVSITICPITLVVRTED